MYISPMKYGTYIKLKRIYWIYCRYLNLDYFLLFSPQKRTLYRRTETRTHVIRMLQKISQELRFFNIFY